VRDVTYTWSRPSLLAEQSVGQHLQKSAPEVKGSVGASGSLVGYLGCRWMADCE